MSSAIDSNEPFEDFTVPAVLDLWRKDWYEVWDRRVRISGYLRVTGWCAFLSADSTAAESIIVPGCLVKEGLCFKAPGDHQRGGYITFEGSARVSSVGVEGTGLPAMPGMLRDIRTLDFWPRSTAADDVSAPIRFEFPVAMRERNDVEVLTGTGTVSLLRVQGRFWPLMLINEPQLFAACFAVADETHRMLYNAWKEFGGLDTVIDETMVARANSVVDLLEKFLLDYEEQCQAHGLETGYGQLHIDQPSDDDTVTPSGG